MIGSLANGSALDGIDVFPNLGYKKDAFLEPSLVSNNSSSHPTNHQTGGKGPNNQWAHAEYIENPVNK